MIIVMRITNNRSIMAPWTNTAKANVLGGITILVLLAALAGLLLSM
jgi:Mn2+/Fe2+ NRAMP family transporter